MINKPPNEPSVMPKKSGNILLHRINSHLSDRFVGSISFLFHCRFNFLFVFLVLISVLL